MKGCKWISSTNTSSFTYTYLHSEALKSQWKADSPRFPSISLSILQQILKRENEPISQTKERRGFFLKARSSTMPYRSVNNATCRSSRMIVTQGSRFHLLRALPPSCSGARTCPPRSYRSVICTWSIHPRWDLHFSGRLCSAVSRNSHRLNYAVRSIPLMRLWLLSFLLALFLLPCPLTSAPVDRL